MIEVELGAGQTDAAAASLSAFARRIDAHRHGEPTLVVITGTGYGYVRPDGIHVVPVGALTT